MKIYVSVVLYLFLCCSGSGEAKSYWQIKDFPLQSAQSASCFTRYHDTTSDFWISVSNRMTLGAPFDSWSFLDAEKSLPFGLPYAFNASYPADRTTEYLHGAGLWVGGIKGEDTLVSHAFDYTVPLPEFLPADCIDTSFGVVPPTYSDFEIIAHACDTGQIIDTAFRCLIGDCNDWYPLGIAVSSRTYRWQSPPYDDILFVTYTIQNIDTAALEQGWVGMFADCDIGVQENAEADDISGFIDGAIDENGEWVDVHVAYTIDTDGDPINNAYGNGAHTGAFAVQFLGLSGHEPDVHFNWWINAADSADETAPRRFWDYRTDLGGSYSVAYGDRNKYHVMSFPEHDYNQCEAGYYHYGWVPQGGAGERAAFGGDTRFLLSAGPFDLQPGETVDFSVAVYIADGVVTNPFVLSWMNPESPQSVSDFYETLRFDDLYEKALAARDAYASDWMLPPPGVPTGFSLIDFDESSATFRWNPIAGNDVSGYILKCSLDKINWTDAALVTDTTAQAVGLLADSVYCFAVVAYDGAGTEGKASTIIELNPNGPHPPFAITGSGEQGFPELHWEYDESEAPLSFRIYRINNNSSDTVLLAEKAALEYIDYGTDVGGDYSYYLTSVTAEGIESPPSTVIHIVPMPMSSGILAVDYNSAELFSNLVFDRAFFAELVDSALNGLAYDYRPFDADNPVTLEDMAEYSLVIISGENRSGSLDNNLESVLRAYLSNGGKVILILRHAGTDIIADDEPAFWKMPATSVLRDYFHVDSAYYGAMVLQSGLRLSGDLIGASPVDGAYPTLTWDSLSVNSFAYACAEGIPYGGFIVPTAGAESLYGYISSIDDGMTDNQINGVAHIGDDYGAVLLNMPLSLMQVDSAAALLRSLAIDLGEGNLCGDINADLQVNVGDVVAYIRYLYFGETPPGVIANGDVDCDEEYAMDDLLVILNFVLRHGLSPRCCR
ncbi:MAG: hypothetical protein R3F48_14485 [Candidatus Zixiibacteriota bacterium]